MQYYEVIDFDIKNPTNNAFGYVINSNQKQLSSWLNAIKYGSSFINVIRSEFDRVAILKSLHVDDVVRGKGIGSSLIKSFLRKANIMGAEAVVLQADTNQEQKPGFNLVSWYEKHGFANISKSLNSPVMLYHLHQDKDDVKSGQKKDSWNVTCSN